MNKTRNICRLVFLLLGIYLVLYINQKTSDNTVSVVEFKFKMYQKINTDSLTTKDKLDLVVNKTSKFVDNSLRVRTGIHYLMGLFGLLVGTELTFLILNKSNNKRLENE